MGQFIVELGSANEHRNDIGYVREMIDVVADCDSGKHTVRFKWQLFRDAPPNRPLLWDVFAFAYGHALELGYETTASVFDVDSLVFLGHFRVPFVKIANRPELRVLIHDASTHAPVYASFSQAYQYPQGAAVSMACVSSYPASLAYYQARFMEEELRLAVSDHTEGWALWEKYQPKIIEKHFCLKRSADNPDSGPFAVTPDELREVL